MRPLFPVALLLLMFCSCEKNDTAAPPPAIDVTGTWQLTATMPDKSWEYVSDKDSALYIFDINGEFKFDAKSTHQRGVYKVLPNGTGIKLIITENDSLSQYFQIEKASDSTIRIDDWLKGISKGSSKLFRKVN